MGRTDLRRRWNAGRGRAGAGAGRWALPGALGEVEALRLADDGRRRQLAVDVAARAAGRLQGLGRARRRGAAQAARAAVPRAAAGQAAARCLHLHALRRCNAKKFYFSLVGSGFIARPWQNAEDASRSVRRYVMPIFCRHRIYKRRDA